MQSFDIVVFGGGPGGYVAAIRAAQIGHRTAVIEESHLGGICLNWGCIPTKALLRSAEVYHLLHRLDDYGLSASDVTFDLDKIVARSRKVASQLSSGVGFLMKKYGITVFTGKGKLDARYSNGQHSVAVIKDGKKNANIKAPRVIIATGARARILPGLEPDGKLIWTYKEALVPDIMPKSLLVIGSGAIGIEFASFYRMLGAEVTVVEVVERVLPLEDEEIGAFAQRAFIDQGMKILTKSVVTELKAHKDRVLATIESDGKKQQIAVERVIVAAGIVGNVEGLGLEGTAVKIEKTHVITGPFGETDEPGLYAIGDVAGPPWLAHKAMHEGILCIEAISGIKTVHPIDRTKIPSCTYCVPQIASLGLSEVEAKKQGYKIKVGRFPFVGNGKAVALGEKEGLVKTVFDAETGELLGAHMIGSEVTELIQGYGIASTLEATEQELMNTVFPHPTLSEMMHESVLSAYGRAIHI